MSELTIKDVFDACCYVPEGMKFPDTAINVSYGIFKENEEMNLDTKTTYGKTNISIRKVEDYVEVDLIFRNHYDSHLKRTLDLLNTYKKDVDNMPEELFPSIQFLLVPFTMKGEFQVLLANPDFFILCSDTPDAYPHMIKLIFDEEQIVIMQNSNIDFNQIAADVKRQMDMEEFYEEEEQKKQKKAEYEATYGFNRMK